MTDFSNGGSAPSSYRYAGELRNATLLAPGLFGSFLAYNAYPLLDGRTVMIWVVCLFILTPALPRLWNILRKRPSEDIPQLPAAYVFSSIALVLLAATLFLNGALDKFPPTVVRTTVVWKAWVAGKSTHYHVIVSSWRPGRSQEDFGNIDGGVFNRAVVGKTVTVELHKGFYSLAWYGNISPE